MFDVQKFAYKVFVLGGTLPFQFQLNTAVDTDRLAGLKIRGYTRIFCYH